MSKPKRITKSFTFDGKRYFIHGYSLQEVYEKMALKKKDLESGRNVVASSMKLSDWAEIAVETYKTNQAESTRDRYMDVLNSCILSRIGSMPLKRIKPIQCQKVLNDYAGYSTAYIRKIKQILYFLFDSARKNNLIAVNPAEDLTVPAGTKTERRSITEKERDALLSAAETNPEYLIYVVMLRCGCRSSEARELKRMDLSEQDGHRLLHIRGKKTKAADRYVPGPS